MTINKNLPSIEKLAYYVPNLSTKIYDRNNILIAEIFNERRSIVAIQDIPDNLINALISIEDKNFFKHCGISIQGLLRALCKLILKRKIVEGGSTITQQLVKSLFLNRERTLTRKIKEIILAIRLERYYSKNDILQLYLNQVYFGNRAYGVQEASRVYFNKDVKNLNLAECATLAAIPKSPNYYNPFNNPKATLLRRNIVLSRMRALNYITEQQEKIANRQDLLKYINAFQGNNKYGQYIIEIIRVFLEQKYGRDKLFNSGLSIYTTIDIKSQILAETILNEYLLKFDNNQKIKFRPHKVQGALISIDVNNGEIIAMVGGRNFQESQFNRATQAARQAGSSFKPFIYVAALEHGLTAATILNDSPLIFIYNNGKWNFLSRDIHVLDKIESENLIKHNKLWIPKNYNKKYIGPIILKLALAWSINTCAVELINRITPNKVITLAKRLGISTNLINSLTLGLGASDVILQEVVSAFAIFASGGIKSKPYIIRKIVDRDGKIIERCYTKQRKVLSKKICFIITDMLKAVIEKGSGWDAKRLHRPCAGKTGTTNNSTDVWFIGYTPQLVTGVWIGYDDRSSLGKKITGGTLACPIWTDFMIGALADYPIVDFNKPKNIEMILLDIKTGLPIINSNNNNPSSLEVFIKGTAPKEI
ncbi:MAG: PBP1A family penicillin-binding protein [Endomicrobium sp.]|nr:PBP1A family penicillin-binding protein [Endomicrobium sp.]